MCDFVLSNVIKMVYNLFKEKVSFDILIATSIYKIHMERGTLKNIIPCACCCLTRIQEIIILCFSFFFFLLCFGCVIVLKP